MLKSISLSVLAVAGLGALLWFVKHEPVSDREIAGSKAPAKSGETAVPGVVDDQKNGSLGEAPESMRHLAQSVQKQALFKDLREAIRAQEEKVEERRKVLSTIVRTKGIVYRGSEPPQNESGGDDGQGAKSALQNFHQLEQETIQLQSQIDCLLKYDSEQLMVYAAGLEIPDNSISDLYPHYCETKRQLEALKINGLGDTHPTVLAARDELENMKKHLDEGVINLRGTLKAQLDLSTERMKAAESFEKATRDEAIKRGLDAQDYVDAKRDFETDQELLQQMKLRLIQEQSALGE
jgi:succinoglycan biosynthesis transport protein ExoP